MRTPPLPSCGDPSAGSARLLVVTAVDREAAAVLAGTAGAVDVDVLAAGVGPAAAAAGTARALAGGDYRAVLSAGVAGGFGPPVGGTVVADRVVAADLGVEDPAATGGWRSVAELGLGPSELTCDAALTAELVARLSAAGRTPAVGTVLTVSTATGTAERAARLEQRWSPVAEAMEGYAVVLAARGRRTARSRAADRLQRGRAARPGGLGPARCAGRPDRRRRLPARAGPMTPGPARSLAVSRPARTTPSSSTRGARPGARTLRRSTSTSPTSTSRTPPPSGASSTWSRCPTRRCRGCSTTTACCRRGGALGRGCGPLVLTRGDLDSLDGRTVAVPGRAVHRLPAVPALGRRAVAGADRGRAVRRDHAGGARRTLRRRPGDPRGALHLPGLRAVGLVDLGEWWERDTGLPIPLGAILARRSLDADALTRRPRVGRARLGRPVRLGRLRRRARRGAVAGGPAAHIALYVNEFTRDLGDEGRAAVRTLLDRAAAAGLVPAVPADSLTYPGPFATLTGMTDLALPAADERALLRALDAVDERAVVAELAALVRVPSVGGSPEESEVQHRLASAMDGCGLDRPVVARPAGPGRAARLPGRRGPANRGLGPGRHDTGERRRTHADPAGSRRRRSRRRGPPLGAGAPVVGRGARRGALRARRGRHEVRSGRLPGGSARSLDRRGTAARPAGAAQRHRGGGRRAGRVRDAGPRAHR